MISTIQNNIAALYAHSAKMGVHGYNIANVNTDGFKKYRVDIVQSSNCSVGTDIDQVNTPGIPYYDPSSQTMRETSNVDLAEEFTQMIPSQIGYKANLKMISAYDEMLGSLFDIFG